jgi:hypothetical protein
MWGEGSLYRRHNVLLKNEILETVKGCNIEPAAAVSHNTFDTIMTTVE